MYLCALYLSLSAVLFVAADPRYLGVDLHAHTLALSVSVSPLPGLSFFPLKRCCAAVVVIIEIQDSFVFGCSHFIKVALIRNWWQRWDEKSSSRLRTKREKVKTFRKSFYFILFVRADFRNSNAIMKLTIVV